MNPKRTVKMIGNVVSGLKKASMSKYNKRMNDSKRKARSDKRWDSIIAKSKESDAMLEKTRKRTAKMLDLGKK